MDKGIQWTDAQALAHAACCALLPPTRLSGVGASPAVAGVTGNVVCSGETYIVGDGKRFTLLRDLLYYETYKAAHGLPGTDVPTPDATERAMTRLDMFVPRGCDVL